jgi:hypothetical protein
MMNVKELIELLNNKNPETRVVVKGYEGGLNDVGEIELIPIRLNVNVDWYYGPHEKCEYDELGKQEETALIISPCYAWYKDDEEIE